MNWPKLTSGGEPGVTLHRSQAKERVARKIADLERLVGTLQEKMGEREEELGRIRKTLAEDGGWNPGEMRESATPRQSCWCR